MYMVTSFDFGGSSTVNIHILTDNLQDAEDVYADVVEKANQTNILVELSTVPTNTRLTDVTLFWGKNAVKSNNC